MGAGRLFVVLPVVAAGTMIGFVAGCVGFALAVLWAYDTLRGMP